MTCPLVNPPSPPVTVVALNSLRDLFHGKPQAPKKALPPKQKVVISWATGVPHNAKVDAFFEAFASSLMARDAKDPEPWSHRITPSKACLQCEARDRGATSH